MWKIRAAALLILLAGFGVGFLVWNTEKAGSHFPFRLGLDLSSGAHLVYRADISKVTSGDVDAAMSSLRDVIERRVNLFGVSEPIVQVEHSGVISGSSEERLIVELPGVTDVNKAIATIGKTPQLEFKLLKKDATLPDDLSSTTPAQFDQYFEPTGLTGQQVKSAQLSFGNGSSQLSNEPMVLLNFNSEGSDLFAKLTKENVGRYLAIFLDGTIIEMPVIREEIPNGTASISGSFTPQSAKDLVRDLNFGALPVPVELISTQTIGASLGSAALTAGVHASIFGFLFIALFLILWYRLPGLLAGVALSVYAALMLAIFKFIPVTLTAAGIAGFILSLGMAVDANILIFERMKEELAEGKDLGTAMRDGFSRAWPSIRDSNSSSIITAIILFWLGTTSVIKGFALVFGIGVIVSMFTAITVSRTLLLSLGFAGQVRGFLRFLFGNGFSK
ncbi:MAG TPA: protein translocase subunit SecD [Candidatus Paceibacterota bacterium]